MKPHSFPACFTHAGLDWSAIIDIALPNRPDADLIRNIHTVQLYAFGVMHAIDDWNAVPEAVRVGLAADAIAAFLDCRAAELVARLEGL